MLHMSKHRIYSLILLIILVFFGYVVYSSQFNKGSFFARFPFKLGLDLNGGTQLVYKADISKDESGSVNDSMDSLRDVIERRAQNFRES